MRKKKNNEISAEQLISVSSRRGKKTGAELGLMNKNQDSSRKPVLYRSIPVKHTNEGKID